ncbi:MAG: BTAD domain-containing putative transcriptional regulator, partial [Gemmatimonadota bacterium]
MIELRVLGALDLRGPDGEEVLSVLAQPMRTALLAYLALARPRGYHRRDTLTALFWPDADRKHARAALRQALYYLGRSLDADPLRKRGQDEIALDPEKVWCDAVTFEDAVDAGEIEEALKLYQGDLLEGFFLSGCPGFERWLEAERTRLRERAARAAWTLAHRELAEGRITAGERLGQRALGYACTDENEVRRFMTALAEAGDRAAAVRFYERFAEELEEALELEPSAETRGLVEGIREGEGEGEGVVATRGTGGESVVEDGPAPSRVEAPRVGPDPAPARRSAGASRSHLAWMGLAAVLVALSALALWRPWRGPVEPTGAAAPPVDGSGLPSPSADRPRIAVLPLENLSASEESAYLAAGLHEELLRRLSLVRSLAVISRTSVLRYGETRMGVREIATDLGVRYIVGGTVQEDGGQVRIHVQLIDAVQDRYVWAERYDRALQDLFALQSQIAEDIARELDAVVTPEERARIESRPTEDPIAYELYLRATDIGYQVKEEYDASVELLRRATSRDPDFALAQARLALT